MQAVKCIKGFDTMTCLRRAMTAMMTLMLCAPAQATVISTTSYGYFTVNGSTPAQIYRSLLNHGPQVNHRQSIASNAMSAIQDGRLKRSNGACKVQGYTIKLRFVTTRPQITNERVLPPADLRLWRQFYSFIKQHEDEHKQVWLNCAAALERRINAISAPSCGQTAARANAMWKQMLATCDREQNSFDSSQSAELEHQPFMRRVRAAAD